MKRLAFLLALLASLCLWSPADAASVSRVTLSPTTVAGGGTVKASVSLASRAGSGGEVVTLSSNSSYADVQTASIRIEEGKSLASFTITTNTTSIRRTAILTATVDGTTKTATLIIDPVGISTVKTSPTLLTSDSKVVGTVTLNASAPAGGYVVSLSDNSSVVDTVSSVTVPAGAKTATFNVTSEPVTSTSTAVITASAAGLNKTTTVTVSPLALTKLSASSSLTGGNDGTGKVTFNGLTSSAGATVSLSSSNPGIVSVPSSVTAPGNVAFVSFVVATNSTLTQQNVTITATFRGVSKAYAITVKPVAMSSLGSTPRTIVGTQAGVVKVNLTGEAPVGGLVATLSSSDGLLNIPSSVAFAAGVVSVDVPITTDLTSTTRVVTITGTINGVAKTSTVTVSPITVSTIGVATAPIGGNYTTFQVGLNAPAPVGGITVELASSNPSMISLPESLDFAEGQRVIEIEFLPAIVSDPTSVNLTASTGGVTKTVTVTIQPAKFMNIGLNSGVVSGGRSLEATITLSGPAPEDGFIVDLSASIVSPTTATVVPAEPPASVLVPAGEQSVKVTFNTLAVSVKTTALITGTSNGKVVSARLTVDPPALQDINPRPLAIRPGSSTQLIVRLTGIAPTGGIAVTLTSSQPSVATVPATAMVPAGSRTVAVNVTGLANATVGASTTIKVTALGKSLDATATISNLLLTDLSLSSETVMGGNLLTGSVTLSGPAPSGGVAVGLDVLDASVTVPGSVIVPYGQSTANFTITTYLVPAPKTVVIYSRFASSVRTADLAVDALAPVSLTVDDADIEGGETSTATIDLNGNTPPASGVIVSASVYASDDDAIEFPATVAFARSSSTATFVITGVPVTVDTPVTILVEVNGQTSDNITITVHPPRVTGLTVQIAELTGGTANTGTVTLSSPAPAGGWAVDLSSSSASATTSATVNVPAGATSKTFTIGTTPVAVLTYPAITAEQDGTSAEESFTIKPPRLVSLTVNDNDLEGGFSSATGSVTLNGPAPTGGWSIALTSSSPTSASVPATVNVPANSTSATFTIATAVVPADASVTVTATKVADTFSQTITVRQIKVTGISLSTGTVQGGTSVTATVTLNRSVPETGVTVQLTDNSAATVVSATMVVPVNQTSSTVTVFTVAVAANTISRITASFNGGTAFIDVTVLAPVVSSVTVSPTTLVGGWATATGTVTISHAAPTGGFPIDLTASNGGASVPATISVAAGTTSATFTITTAVVGADRSVTIGASRNGVELTTTIVVTPLVVSALSVSPSPLVGGDQSATGTITLNANAPAGGAVVTVSSSHTSHVTVPATVTVPAGTTSTTFTVTTLKKATPQAATITTTYNDATRTASLQVNAPTPTSLSISPGSVTGGSSATGTVTLNSAAPTGGMPISLSSNSLFASVPSSVTVGAGSTTATFTISTLPLGLNTTATITATANGTSRTATLTLNAPTLTGLSLSQSSVVGGTTVIATASISSAAPSGGLTITMASDKAQAVPAAITIAAGQTTGTANVTSQAVATSTTATITASLNGTNRTASLTLTAVTFTSLSLSTSTVLGGTSLTATAVIGSAAPAGGLTITMTSDRTQATPASIVIAAGQTSGTATITTQGVTVNSIVTITGTLNGATRTASFTINRTTVAGVSVSPTSVRGGNNFSFTVTLNGVAPAGGLWIEAGDNSGNVSMPASITVPAGASSATITVGTNDVSSTQIKQVGVYYDSITYYCDLTLLD